MTLAELVLTAPVAPDTESPVSVVSTDTSAPAADDTRRGQKSDAAYRTISEVATDLNLPQHVLRFWESKFKQISPLKRGGGRRYYRPQDVDLIRRIHYLLHIQGYTIKGVQKLLTRDRTLAHSVPTLTGADTASVAVSETLAHAGVTLAAANDTATDDAATLSPARFTDMRLLLDKLKNLRSQLDNSADQKRTTERC